MLLLIASIEGGHLSWALLAFPLLVAVQFVLTLSLAYLLAAANVYVRDVQYLLPLALQLGYFVTPIFFTTRQVPAAYQFVFDLNPMKHVIEAIAR